MVVSVGVDYCENCGRIVSRLDLKPQRDAEDSCTYEMCPVCRREHQDRIEKMLSSVVEDA